MSADESEIVTFSSHQGGIGRSMAVATVAWILAGNGRRVLAVDADLAAPGLHRWLRPFLADPELTGSPGLVDLLWEAGPAPDTAGYAMPVRWEFPGDGRLDLLPAGRQDAHYADKVSAITWQPLSFPDALTAAMRERYDYVLIDSRTGRDGPAGVCAPDTLIACFTLTRPGIDGAVAAALTAAAATGRALRVLPVAMRVDHGERLRHHAGTSYARRRFAEAGAEPLEVEVPYRAAYAYDEVLAAFGDPPARPGSVLAALERLTSGLTGHRITAGPELDEDVRRVWLPRFTPAGDEPDDDEPDGIDLSFPDDRDDPPGEVADVLSFLPGRRPGFVGRRAALAGLAAGWAVAAKQTPPGRPVTQVLAGLPGVGKTQLALEFAHRHRGDYDLVWWVPAGTTASIETSLRELAGRLGLAQDTAAGAVFPMLWRRLSGRGRWLMIFDNVRDADLLGTRHAPAAAGHVLLTSRSPEWPEPVRTVGVPVLDRAESVRVLLAGRTGQDPGAAAELAAALGDLPLALSQATAYMDSTGTGVVDYLTLFRRQATGLPATGRPRGFTEDVASAVRLVVAQVQRERPVALDLLRLLSFLAPDAIPRGLPARHPDTLPGPLAAAVAGTAAYEDLIGALRRHSLVEVSEATITVHRLVQAVIRADLGAADRRSWVLAALRLLTAAFPADTEDFLFWPDAAALAPHGVAAAGRLASIDPGTAADVRLLELIGRYQRARDDLFAARDSWRLALRSAGRALDRDDPQVIALRYQLAALERELGAGEVARADLAEVLRLAEGRFGQADPRTVVVRSELGRSLVDLGDLGAARDCLERALRDTTALGDEQDVVRIGVHARLGKVYQDLGRHRPAARQFEEALDGTRRIFGVLHRSEANRLNDVAGVRQLAGDLRRAREDLQLAEEIAAYTCPDDDLRMIAIRNNLAGVLHDLGHWDEARELFDRLSAVVDDAAAGHPLHVVVITNVGALLQDLGRYGDAVDRQRRALVLSASDGGETAPRTAVERSALACALTEAGRLDEAVALHDMAGSAVTGLYGDDHPRVAAMRVNRSEALRRLGRCDEALAECRHGLAATIGAYGPDHPRIGLIQNQLGLILTDLGRPGEALRAFDHALGSIEQMLAFRHPFAPAVRGNRDRVRDRTRPPQWLRVIVRTYQQLDGADAGSGAVWD